LIIFMVTAPMMKQGMDVALPKTSTQAIPSEEERLVVTVSRDHKIYIDEFETDIDSLQEKLEHIFQTRTNKEAFLRADEVLPYGFVMQVLSRMKQAGITKLGMVTEPLEKK
jgi:biopolymer transport protein TolR